MFKLFLVLCLVGLSLQADCDDNAKKQAEKCQPFMEEMIQKSDEHKKNTEVKPEVIKGLSTSCRKSLDCYATVDCSVIKKAISRKAEKSCEIAQLVDSILPCINKIVETVPKSANKHSCLKENNIDASSSDFRCKLLKTGTKCAGPIAKDVCGADVSNKFDQIDLGLILLKCN